MNISILSIGDELLMGKVVNTNSAHISKKLSELGLPSCYQITCADIEKDIVSSLDLLLTKSDLVIVTGGLGITEDDKTKAVIAKYIGQQLVMNEEAKEYTLDHYKGREADIPQHIESFYMLPEQCKTLRNYVGVAQGFIVTHEKKKIAVFPGPPEEMTSMFDRDFLEVFKTWNTTKTITKYFKIYGVGELEVVSRVEDLLSLEKNGVFLTTYCNIKEVTLVLRYDENKVAFSLVEEVIYEITKRFSRNLYSFENEELESALMPLLVAKRKKIAVAESITGGNITNKLISIPGMGNHLVEGIVSYTNESKIARLNVSSDTIDENSAVSEEVAYEMCRGLLANPMVDIAVATTGYAGPANGTDDVGHAYIGIGTRDSIQVREYKFYGNRDMIREACGKQSLFSLINIIKYNEI